MTVHLKSKTTDEVLQEFKDVDSFTEAYILFYRQGNTGKIYAATDQYFALAETDTEIESGEQLQTEEE